MDAVVAQLAATRDLRATWLVVDQDAFFASCAELLDPSLVRQTVAMCPYNVACIQLSVACAA